MSVERVPARSALVAAALSLLVFAAALGSVRSGVQELGAPAAGIAHEPRVAAGGPAGDDARIVEDEGYVVSPPIELPHLFAPVAPGEADPGQPGTGDPFGAESAPEPAVDVAVDAPGAETEPAAGPVGAGVAPPTEVALADPAAPTASSPTAPTPVAPAPTDDAPAGAGPDPERAIALGPDTDAGEAPAADAPAADTPSDADDEPVPARSPADGREIAVGPAQPDPSEQDVDRGVLTPPVGGTDGEPRAPSRDQPATSGDGEDTVDSPEDGPVDPPAKGKAGAPQDEVDPPSAEETEPPEDDAGEPIEDPDKDAADGAEDPDKDAADGAEDPDKDAADGSEDPVKDAADGSEDPVKDEADLPADPQDGENGPPADPLEDKAVPSEKPGNGHGGPPDDAGDSGSPGDGGNGDARESAEAEVDESATKPDDLPADEGADCD